MENYMQLEIMAISVNEGFARNVLAAFALPLNPSLSALADVKTAVSEAVTNCIVHAYKDSDLPPEERKIILSAKTYRQAGKGVLHIKITDFGKGIEDVPKALTPFYTTLNDEERSGMGFTVMETFMNSMSVESAVGKGTSVTLEKIFEEEA